MNVASSLMIIRQILQSENNSIYPTIFIIIHNLITYTTLCTNHLKLYKKNIIMAKSPLKRHKYQSNWRTSIQRRVKVKRTKKLQNKSSRKAESTKVNAIMEQLGDSDGNEYRSKNNINNFSPLYKSENE